MHYTLLGEPSSNDVTFLCYTTLLLSHLILWYTARFFLSLLVSSYTITDLILGFSFPGSALLEYTHKVKLLTERSMRGRKLKSTHMMHLTLQLNASTQGPSALF
jgi:hypothetical protein